MIIYYAGTEKGDKLEQLKSEGVKNFLGSYFYLRKYHYHKSDNVLIDSGGFTARKSGKPINVEDYVKFINDNNVQYAFNLDTNDVEETLSNQRVLENKTTAYIIPIYHYSDYADKKHRGILDDYIKKYEYISLGGVAGVHEMRRKQKNFLDYSFNKTRDKIKVHGLGMTSIWQLERYPFYSVDSTSWLQGERWFLLVNENKGKFHNTFIRNKKKMLKNFNKSLNLDKLYNEKEHLTYHAIRQYQKIEKYYTKLWESRNIKWVS